MEIGGIIKRLREKNGWSQEELAHRAGMSTANLSRIETGRHGAGVAVTATLAKEFGLEVYELYALAAGVEVTTPSARKVAQHLLSKDEALLIQANRGMSRDRRRLLMAAAEVFSAEAGK